ncbi:sensor domain-containing diguanylate cyclase [Alkalicoccus urumqiensis]|uniref:GGDEF domain-containing protein n=1 Tax=Alkalicoccus urumqiensis TaxID=1548213 RepID=A0A2P6MJU3_ALKUR|nr:sensor domain-containing diguanylate cyclase [Alkalicoccus urumqiensis]PRO66547.1 GGDEF domain-containing protein [Alkalicoccus urumqiensis]
MFTSYIIGVLTGILLAALLFAVFIYVVRPNTLFRRYDRRFMHLVETSNDFMYAARVYPKVKFDYLSPSAENFFGPGSNKEAYVSPEAPFRDVHPDDAEMQLKKIRGEIDYSRPILQRWRDQYGNYRWFEEYATPIYKNGRLIALQGVLRNIDERVELEEQLHYQLYHDALTDVYNRTFFEKKRRELDEETDAPAAIFVIDLNNLKQMNDRFGHSSGDNLICLTASILKEVESETVLPARVGGDEFALLLTDTTMDEMRQIRWDILQRVQERRFDVKEDCPLTIAIGSAFTPSSLGRMEELFMEADQNMYKEKYAQKTSPAQ